jgi:hypothetical protein
MAIEQYQGTICLCNIKSDAYALSLLVSTFVFKLIFTFRSLSLGQFKPNLIPFLQKY